MQKLESCSKSLLGFIESMGSIVFIGWEKLEKALKTHK